MKILIFAPFLFCNSFIFGADVPIRDGFEPDKYGLVRVYNEDKTINREYKISKDTLEAFRSQVSSVPIGVTEEEWISGRTLVLGKGFEVGDAQETRSGWVKVKYAEVFDGTTGTFQESFLSLAPGEWSGIFPGITVLAEKMDEIDREDSKRARAYKKDVLEITGGVLRTR